MFVQEQMEIKFGGDQSNEMGGVGEVVSVQHEEALVAERLSARLLIVQCSG